MIVGIDFGTTNTRVAIWEPQAGGLPNLKTPGKGMRTVMPSVVAFERTPGGSVVIRAVGEDADELQNGPNTVVVRNIKRWALASDPFVREALESMPSTPWPPILDIRKRSIELWGQSIAISEIILAIIAEALKRVGLLNTSCELRAACPVQSDFTYRQDMVNVFSRLGFISKVTWVTDEPLLFLALAYSLGRLGEGSYLVYDFGGGSFDCALATVERQQDAIRLTVYAADGNPLLGGMDVDEKLRARLKYDGPPNLLRLAKEEVCRNPSTPGIDLPGGFRLSWFDVEAVLKEEKFIERTVDIMMKVYRQAKAMWKRPPDAPPLGEVLEQDAHGVIKRTIWQLREHDLARDVDKVLLFGGTTRIPSVVQRLETIFGPEKVVPAFNLLPAFSEPELTAVALSASYTVKEKYVPLYVNRLPGKVILHLRQASAEQRTEYAPFCRFPLNPSAPYISKTLVLSSGETDYEATVEDADGGILHTTGWCEARMPQYLCSPNWLRIVIDRFGRIWLDMITGREDKPIDDQVELLEIPPWQTSAQRAALQRMWRIQREYEESERARTLRNITRNPYGWGEDVG